MSHPTAVPRALAAAAILLAAAAADAQTLRVETFDVTAPSEVHAVVTARCAGCDWGQRGREAAVLTVTVNGRESQDLVLARGAEPAEYAIALGPAAPGKHRVSISLDRKATAPVARDVFVDAVQITVIRDDDPRYLAAAYAPILHARPDALARFSDVPLLLWYETDALPDGGQRIRYSVVFSNEDGGTPPDRLMATWGRLTDIEFAYGVELDASGRVVSELYQGKGHEIVPFRGHRLGLHPLLWVVTDNNMLAETGKGRRRIAPAPFPFDLASVSREAVMDAHPWTYRVSSEEARREGRVREGARPGSRLVPDPRRFAYLEACADVKDATLTFAVATRREGGLAWHESNGDMRKYRIQRSADHFPNGCFRGAVALPEGTSDADIAGLRLRAYTREPEKNERPLARGAATANLTRVNKLFRLGDDYSPARSLMEWSGDLRLDVDGAPTEVPVSADW